MPNDIFVHSREPDPAWQADLDRIAPRSERVNWLKIAWVAGKDYEPIGRWFVYEMCVDVDRVDPAILEDFNGPDPAVDGMWKPDPDMDPEMATKKDVHGVGMRWASNSFISHVQWQLFHETGCLPNPTWVIQGDKGGHLWRLGEAEVNALERFNIQTTDTPAPGSLPYADYDYRVSAKLAQHDKLRKWHKNLAWEDRGMTKTKAGLIVRQDRHEQEMGFNREMVKWLEGQIDDAFADFSRVNLPQVSDFSGMEAPAPIDEDELDRSLIEDTSVTM